MQARIYQLPKSATQSGKARTDHWVLEFEPEHKREVEPLMGWTTSSDTQTQVRLFFPSKEDAIRHCEREGYMYSVEPERRRTVKPKWYGDNFTYGRLGMWTH
ncbi:ETC complex I subunit conserved region [Limimonas halophila]|uniref:ETC complex I subunit conserved region n=1 Tax=Limimonas halophila TaxID=1082479 RepID=A0A1G7NUI7_9PROT|nr:ETC complex I subunit [Limimonas halophila]SDF76860.1 ETC complex I subunit conserved region [Limimonas halophila]